MRIAFFLILAAALLIFIFNVSYGNDLYDEEVIIVDGQVSGIEAEHEKSPSRNKKDLVKFRKRISSSNFQSPPPDGSTSSKLRVVARSYCIRGFTSRGAATRMGVIAVDPAVIPLGSRIYVPGYGWGTALDTGGAIRGNSIDLWLPTYSQCMQWGVRSVTITVVKP